MLAADDRTEEAATDALEGATDALEAFEVAEADVALEETALELEVGFQLTLAPPKGLAHPGVYFWVEGGATDALTAYLAKKVWTSAH